MSPALKIGTTLAVLTCLGKLLISDFHYISSQIQFLSNQTYLYKYEPNIQRIQRMILLMNQL